jgi:hypothetical protein
MPQHPEPHIRRAVRVLSAVGELHKRGYQRLRVMPYMAPSGGFWWCSTIGAVDRFYGTGQSSAKYLTLILTTKPPLQSHDIRPRKRTIILIGVR